MRIVDQRVRGCALQYNSCLLENSPAIAPDCSQMIAQFCITDSVYELAVRLLDELQLRAAGPRVTGHTASFTFFTTGISSMGSDRVVCMALVALVAFAAVAQAQFPPNSK